MKFTALQHSIILTLVAFAISACATSKPVGEWRSENFSGALDNILIIGVTSRSTRRQTFENKFVEALAAHQTTAVPSYELIVSTLKLTRESVETAIAKRNLDAVLITRLAGIADKSVYRQPDDEDRNLNYFSFQDGSLSQVEKGYYEQRRVVTLETRLYDAASGEMVWSMQSEIADPSQPRKAIEDQIKLTVDRLRKQGLIGRKS